MRSAILGAPFVAVCVLWAGPASADTTPDPTTTVPPAPVTTTPPPAPEPEPVPEPAPPPEPAPAPAPAPAATLAPKLSGFVDGTYNYNVGDPAGGVNVFVPYTSRHNTFDLNTMHLAITGSDDQLTYDVEVDAGSDATVNSANYGGNFVDLQEAWGAYTARSGLGFKVGKFVTTEGIEVIESGSNPTISRGLLFTLAEPATFVGALGTYKLNAQSDVALGVTNGWDQLTDNNSLRTFMGKYGYSGDKLGLTLSALAGPEQNGDNKDWRFSVDATADVKLTNLDLWLQANGGAEQGTAIGGGGGLGRWVGAGVQPVYKVNGHVTLGARAEVFADLKGARTGAKQTLFDVSVAPAYALSDHVTMRCEARLDASSQKAFVSRAGDASSLQAILTTEALIAF